MMFAIILLVRARVYLETFRVLSEGKLIFVVPIVCIASQTMRLCAKRQPRFLDPAVPFSPSISAKAALAMRSCSDVRLSFP